MRIINQIETTQYPSPKVFCESKLNDPNRIKILGVGSSMREKSQSTQALKVVYMQPKNIMHKHSLLNLHNSILPM